jgi:hypothetical protein
VAAESLVDLFVEDKSFFVLPGLLELLCSPEILFRHPFNVADLRLRRLASGEEQQLRLDLHQLRSIGNPFWAIFMAAHFQ